MKAGKALVQNYYFITYQPLQLSSKTEQRLRAWQSKDTLMITMIKYHREIYTCM